MVIYMLARTLRYAAAVILCMVITARAVDAVSFTYGAQIKKIKAGVLLYSTYIDPDPDKRPLPYVFQIMDQRTDLKPAGWEFYNPYASSHVTKDIADRWVDSSSGKSRYIMGTSIDKTKGCYWEVPISSMQPEEIANYDVLFLSGYDTMIFTARDREKLRKFVDNGGVLWVCWETSGGGQTAFDDTFFTSLGGSDLGFNNTNNPNAQAVVPMQTAAHALLNRPFYLSHADVQNLGGYGPPGSLNRENIVFGGSASNIFVPLVLRDTLNQVTIAAAQYGSGYIIVTADNVGQAITDPVGEEIDANTKVPTGRCRDLYVAAHPEDLKLAYNIVNWGSEHPTFRKNPRHTGSSFEEVGTSLVNLWRFQVPAANKVATDSAPVILDDMVFYVDGQNILHAFDLSPVRSRNQSGDPDDGIRDYSLGAPFDEIWNYQLPGPSSPPTAAYAPLGAAAATGREAVPSVFVVTQGGKVFGFNALAFNPNTGQIANPEEYFTAQDQQLYQFNVATGIPAPTYADGMLFVGDGFGLIHVHEFFKPAGSGNEWCHPTRDTNTNPLGLPSSPTVGYYYDPSTGATEQLAYIAMHGVQSGTNADGMIRSYPIRVFNEILTKEKPDDWTDWRFRTRSSNSNINPDPLTYALYWAPAMDQMYPAKDANPTVPIGTTGRFDILNPNAIPNMVTALQAGGVLTADYRINYIKDPGAVNPVFAQYRAIPIHHPNSLQGQPPRQPDYAGISGTPAANRNDTLYFGTENGSIYAVNESGRSMNQYTPLIVKWRWYLGDPQVKTVLGSGAFGGRDNIVGSPAFVGDMVYFAVNDDGGQGYLLAFKADPVVSVTLDNPIDPNHNQVTVRQDDNMVGLTDINAPTFMAVPFTDADKAAPNTTVLVDYDTHKLTFPNFRPRGAGSELTATQDLLITYTPYDPKLGPTATPPTVTERHYAFAAGKRDQLNNLVWYMRLQTRDPATGMLVGAKVSASPIAMGNVVYMGCENGTILGVDVSKVAQATGLKMISIGNQKTGVMSALFDDLYCFVADTGSRTAVTAPLAGSHGMLAIASANGLSIMYNPVTLVADGNRIVEIDAKGDPIWTCDSTNAFRSTYATATGSASGDHAVYGMANTAFNRPSVARHPSIGGTVVADTGNNRIVHIDRGGNAIWEIKDFAEWDTANPVVEPDAPMELNKPTDVTCWVAYAPADPSDPKSPILPVYNYLIADSGNHRVIQIMNRWYPVAQARRNFVVQVSKDIVNKTQATYPVLPGDTPVEGRALRFNTARIAAFGPNGPTEVVAAVSYEDTSKPDMAGIGGALVDIDWTTGLVKDGTISVLHFGPGNTEVRLMNPTFFNRQQISNTETVDLVIDAQGIHVIDRDGNTPATYRRYLSIQHQDIDENTGVPISVPTLGVHQRPFAPSYAQYLPNGNILVTNKATGEIYVPSPTGPVKKAFYGEVFELTPDPALPIGLIRVPKSTTAYMGTANLRQPLSAERAMY